MENSNTNQMELKDDKDLLEDEKSNSENQSSETNLPRKDSIKEFSNISMSSSPTKSMKKETSSRQSFNTINKIKLNAKMDFVDVYSSNDGAKKPIDKKGSLERSPNKMKKKNV